MEQRERHEKNYAYLSLGFYPCGDKEDMDTAVSELEAEGFRNPTEKAAEKCCIKMIFSSSTWG